MICVLFSGLEQRYGVANYEKVVWFKRVHAVVSCIWRRVGVGGESLQPTSWFKYLREKEDEHINKKHKEVFNDGKALR